MTTTENKSEDRLWDVSVISNKSWLDIMEEEERELELARKGISPLKREPLSGNNSPVPFNGVLTSTKIKVEPEDDEAQDVGISPSLQSTITPLSDLPTFGKMLVPNSEGILSKTPIKKEPSEFLQEDISLTGHLDCFKLVSPCKKSGKSILDDKQPGSFKTPEKYARTPVKEVGSCKRKLPGVKAEDVALMPSPSKISRKSSISTPPTDHTRKRGRDALTPTPKRSPTKKKREPETDPEVIARRQKQIDYGKNTVGYDRYRQLVPRDSRKKMYPRTPPLHLKFSRRAWDGLVKVWRQRLHFWDPPSEGGGNPDCLDVHSEISDCSSTDGSLPSTPVQEWKRQKSSSTGMSPFFLESLKKTKPAHQKTKRSLSSMPSGAETTHGEDFAEKTGQILETSEEFLSQGCTPLQD